MTRPALLPALLALAAGLGCLHRSPEATYHTLRPAAAPASAAPGPALEVMPIRLPDLLQGSQIYAATGSGALQALGADRWAHGLEQDMRRVLAEDLGALLGSDAVVAYPYGERVGARYRVEVEVRRFEGRPGGSLVLDAAWMISAPAGGEALARKVVHLEEPVQGSGAEALVAAHSRALARLGAEVAEGVRRLPPAR